MSIFKCRDQSGCRHSERETKSYCNIFFHWLRPYWEWSMKWDVGIWLKVWAEDNNSSRGHQGDMTFWYQIDSYLRVRHEIIFALRTFGKGIQLVPMDTAHKGPAASIFSLRLARIIFWTNNRKTGEMGHLKAYLMSRRCNNRILGLVNHCPVKSMLIRDRAIWDILLALCCIYMGSQCQLYSVNLTSWYAVLYVKHTRM